MKETKTVFEDIKEKARTALECGAIATFFKIISIKKAAKEKCVSILSCFPF
ncbi:hypothetical protein KHA94_05295 [Bacillus sp. FJAT-49705]|uniref:Cyclic lactone autoinducer peptide n=1 Tax=Cytobacillus citreus TaxID=2833586 RepID=A0ABS5NP82_9BACI|nr:hypothetical protein [Cytobacillus citreus]MBS4189626.1 hypothetical protein [Cytobacillus citreus]